MNTIAEYILYIYIVVLLSMLFFDIVSAIYKQTSDLKIERDTKKIINKIKKENIKKISSKHLKELTRKLIHINYFISFTQAIETLEPKDRNIYLQNIKGVFLEIYPYYQNQETSRQTYYLHFLTQYPFIYEDKKDTLITYIIKCTTQKSIYLREKALNALYALGNPIYIKEAFYQMNFKNIKHHHKLITDGLLKYQGNITELATLLITEFKDYNEEYQVAFINYFGYKNVNCCRWILNILKSEKSPKEVRIACIRYFSHILYAPAISTLYDLLKDDKNNWEYAAIGASTLGKYPCQETIEVLKRAIQSPNWYVRKNAAVSLISMTNATELKEFILSSNDRYAKEMLIYQFNLMKGREYDTRNN